MLYKIRYWIPIAIAVTALCGLVYAGVQQVYRQLANDQQIQISEDLASLLSDGRDPAGVVPKSNIDIADSLATFVIVYDNAGQVAAGSAMLHGKIPTPPAGVFDYVRIHHQTRLTWMPEPGVRIASVITRFDGSKPGYVLAGRSLRETEARVKNLTTRVGLAWLLTMITTLIATIIFVPKNTHP